MKSLRTSIDQSFGRFIFFHVPNYTKQDLRDVVQGWKDIRVTVVGDAIVDEYIQCNPLGMSAEEPTIVVTPISQKKFLGGAAIVAAHMRGLGAAEVNFLSVVGHDATANFVSDKLDEYHITSHLITDNSRPTTLKQRFNAKNKNLLRISHLRDHNISQDLENQLLKQFTALVDQVDLLIFSDFSYGVLTQRLVDRLTILCLKKNIVTVADSQSSSQMGDISRFKNMRLVTPTEREIRMALGNSKDGLVVLAEKLRAKTGCQDIIITLGDEGLLIHAQTATNKNWHTDKLPAMNIAPQDHSGAGDCLLACTAMAIASGAPIWKGAYLGSVAAACQVGRIGNFPLQVDELLLLLAD